ncbi:MAG: HAD family hydrolase [Nitrososphaeria archaeon]|nr:HAD family hydrolase [Nitrososphaeria archaeon]
MPKTNAVLFDLGGTLVKGSDTLEVAKVYASIMEKYGVVRNVEEIARVYEELNTSSLLKKIILMEGRFWVNFNLLLLERLNVRDRVLEIADVMDRMWWNHVKITLYEDVVSTLETLRGDNITLGVISNSLESDIEHILNLADIGRFFTIKVGIDTFKCVKPEKEIFTKTIEKYCLDNKRTLFVGDSLENDYFGPLNAGIKAILLDRLDKIRVESVRKISSLIELIDYL